MEDLFEFMIGFASWADMGSTEKYLALCEEGCKEYNKQNKTDYDFFEILEEYLEYKNQIG